MFVSTKTYGHEIGLSCAFRLWRAQSHSRFVHWYALAFRFEFATYELDARNWVVDFGGLKSLKASLERFFDHTLVVAEDDPELPFFLTMQDKGLAQVRVLPATGCEATAKIAYDLAEIWLQDNGYRPRVWLLSVEVSEHGANSAIYRPFNS
jgi:6-pyruvoyltetrahydropterin/6-carboxytetrahydropterin synthase